MIICSYNRSKNPAKARWLTAYFNNDPLNFTGHGGMTIPETGERVMSIPHSAVDTFIATCAALEIELEYV
jgi:hypothetical protein